MSNTTLNNIAKRQLLNALGFASYMYAKDMKPTDPRGFIKSMDGSQFQMAIADAYDWASEVKDAVNTLTPVIGWPSLEEMQQGKSLTPAANVDASDEVLMQYLFDADPQAFYTQAYWFAKAMMKDSTFETIIKTPDQVLKYVHADLDTDFSEPTDDNDRYDGTNLKKWTEWCQKQTERQEFLRIAMPLIESSTSLKAIHKAVVESHKDLIEQSKQEKQAKREATAKQLFGDDFAFQSTKDKFEDSPIPTFQ